VGGKAPASSLKESIVTCKGIPWNWEAKNAWDHGGISSHLSPKGGINPF